MSQTITIRLTRELSDWLSEEAQTAGVPQSRIVREQLERARAGDGRKKFMRLAGSIRGGSDSVSERKGFSTR